MSASHSQMQVCNRQRCSSLLRNLDIHSDCHFRPLMLLPSHLGMSYQRRGRRLWVLMSFRSILNCSDPAEQSSMLTSVPLLGIASHSSVVSRQGSRIAVGKGGEGSVFGRLHRGRWMMKLPEIPISSNPAPASAWNSCWAWVF